MMPLRIGRNPAITEGAKLRKNCVTIIPDLTGDLSHPDGPLKKRREMSRTGNYQTKIEPIKAISIRQPWAWLILNAGKDVENRTWGTKFRGEVLIHTGKTQDKDGYRFADDMGIDIPREEIRTGGFVGKMKIVDCVEDMDSDWFFGPYGFVVEDAEPIEFVEYPGQLGFFNVKPELVSV